MFEGGTQSGGTGRRHKGCFNPGASNGATEPGRAESEREIGAGAASSKRPTHHPFSREERRKDGFAPHS